LPQGLIVARGTITIVGGGGFIGRALVASLRADGTEVRVLGSDDPLVEAGRPSSAIATAETVIYLASTINPQIAEIDPSRAATDRATLRALLESLQGAERPRRLIFPGSGGTVYDPATTPPYHEDSPVRPVTAYGKAKRAMEELVQGHAPDGCQPVILRISNVYGPGQRVGTGQGVIAHWLAAAAADAEVVLYGAKTITRDFVYIDDVVAAFARAIEAPAPPGLVNIGSGEPTTLAHLAATIAGVVSPRRLRVRQKPQRAFDLSRSYLAVDRAAATIGWKPAVSLPEGIGRTWEWLGNGRRPLE
jgi:UDP-glucose 4-epimerase